MTGKYERVVLERRVLDRPLAVGHGRRHARGVRRRRARRDPEPRAARRRSSARLERRRAVAGPAEPPRLRDRGVLPAVRRHDRLSELQRVAGRARRGQRAARALPLLQLLVARAAGLPALRRRRISSRPGFGTERVEAEVTQRVSRARASRGSIATRSARKGSLASLLSRFRDGEIDVLVGTQMIAKGHDFPARHAGRRRLGGRRPRPRRLPRLRADVPAADPGRRPRRPRRAAGRSDRPDALSRPLQHPARVPAGLPGVLRARAAVPPRDALSAVRLAGQRRRARRARSPARWTMRRISRSGCGGADGAACACSGPAPAPLGKLRGEYRAQFLIKGTNRKQMREALQARARPRGRSCARRTSSTSIRCQRSLRTGRVIESIETRLPSEAARSARIGRRREAERRTSRPRTAPAAAACDRAARPRRTSRGWCGPNTNSITIISTVQTIQLDEKNVSTTAHADHHERDVGRLAARAPRTRCGRRRADRSGTGSARSPAGRTRRRTPSGAGSASSRPGCVPQSSHDASLNSSGSPSSNPLEVRRARATTCDIAHADEQRRHRDEEAGDRAGDADVEQHPLARDRLADADERAERAGQQRTAPAGRTAATHRRHNSGRRSSARARGSRGCARMVPLYQRPCRQQRRQRHRQRGRARNRRGTPA